MKTLLRVLAVAMAALFTVDAASAATANSAATVKVTIGRRSERVAFEAERMTRYMTMALDLTARQESKLYYLNLEWADRCDRYTDRVDLDIIVDRWYYEYTRELDVILNNRQMRKWRNRYGHRFGDYNRPRASISINIGARPHVHIGGGHKNPHKDPHTAPHKDPHTKPHVAPHTKPHVAPHKGNVGNGGNRPSNNNGNVGNGGNRPSNNNGNVGNGGNRPSNNKGSYRSSSSSNRGNNNATRNGGSTRSSNSSNNSRDKGTSSRGR
ncbi:MAG: hypothetical protein IJ377_01460 [Rikenellaceae bacterium]|nr:hypothetical protein [Rikenellaceae bacterium]